LIVPEGKPNVVAINLRMNDETIGNRVWYTSVKTLVTHSSTVEFTEEKSPRVKRLIIEDKILCNGYDCKHICYCKYFNQSRTAISKAASKQLSYVR
jgi:hypothetical protein